MDQSQGQTRTEARFGNGQRYLNGDNVAITVVTLHVIQDIWARKLTKWSTANHSVRTASATDNSFNSRRDGRQRWDFLTELTASSFEILKCKSMKFHNLGSAERTVKYPLRQAHVKYFVNIWSFCIHPSRGFASMLQPCPKLNKLRECTIRALYKISEARS
jgi:hypothetical protein